ncbi:GNAT family N-acetyltransferase [Cellulomonas sp. Sa3CUA2]|uniref:GNAT family N-acetyltransferase n=1 Tax=Cellulomonas avistercoris TaxID=2762242 RepID=A0ABR8QHG5_9CELL|nr:GNAT family N-acetyltransferase [Cellulomonas avistercoris]MBD7919873.1 GNAT family N-acetyltransferase [Cellulomonas avistercoris]
MATTTTPVLRAGAFADLPQPVLAADDLVLRPWRRGDVDTVVAAYLDPAVQHWHARTMSADEAAAWVDHWQERWARDTGAGWAVTAGGDVVGQVSVRQVHLHEACVGLSYWVLPHARGRGVAVSALEAVTSWAFGLGVHRADLDHSTRNPASCRVATKAGYAAEGTAVARGLHADGWHDMHLHSRIAPTP